MEKITYYTKPKEKIFQEVKEKAKNFWKNKYDTLYIKEKTVQIDSMNNISDNMMSILGMFYTFNLKSFAETLSEETKKAIRERLLDGEAYTEAEFFKTK